MSLFLHLNYLHRQYTCHLFDCKYETSSQNSTMDDVRTKSRSVFVDFLELFLLDFFLLDVFFIFLFLSGRGSLKLFMLQFRPFTLGSFWVSVFPYFLRVNISVKKAKFIFVIFHMFMLNLYIPLHPTSPSKYYLKHIYIPDINKQ